MPTTYILHGGETYRSTELNRKFFREMTDSVANHTNVLLVFYSRPEEIWHEKFEQYRKIFSDVDTSKTLDYQCADTNLEIFKKQISNANLIYFHGGETQLLLDKIKGMQNLKELFNEKIISGSSAGACMLSTYFQTGNPGKHARKGLGILPIKVFVHYSEDKIELLKELEEIGEDLPIYKIPEEMHVVIRQS